MNNKFEQVYKLIKKLEMIPKWSFGQNQYNKTRPKTP